LPITLLIFAQCLRKWQLITSLLGIVIGFLDMVKLHIFIPVTDSGFVGVFRTTLQLLDCVLHIFYSKWTVTHALYRTGFLSSWAAYP
jgi:hypothetical protein